MNLGVLCHAAGFYGEWCVIFWAGAKILKTSNLPPCDAFIGASKRLLIDQLLAPLTANLPFAGPPDLGQMAEALRLLLLVDLKADAFEQKSASFPLDSWKPPLLRQSLLPASELVAVLQVIAKYLMLHSERLEAMELLCALRLFVQLDLLYCLDIETEAQKDNLAGVPGVHCVVASEEGGLALPLVSVISFLRSALTRVLKAIKKCKFNSHSASNSRLHVPKLAGACHRETEATSLQMFANSLLRSVTLKYPEEIQRLPQATRRRVIRLAHNDFFRG